MEETCPREEEEEEEEEWVIDHERIAKWRRWARYGVIVGAILNRAITYGLYYGSGVLLLPFLCRFHAGRAATVGAFSVTAVFLALSAPVAKRITTQYFVGACFLVGIFLSSLGVFITSQGNGLYDLYLFYGLMLGIGLGFTVIGTMVDLPSYFPPEEHNKALALAHTGDILGLAIVPYFASVVVKELGWRTGVLLIGGATGACMIPSVFLLRPWFKYQEGDGPTVPKQGVEEATASDCDDDPLLDDGMSTHQGSEKDASVLAGHQSDVTLGFCEEDKQSPLPPGRLVIASDDVSSDDDWCHVGAAQSAPSSVRQSRHCVVKPLLDSYPDDDDDAPVDRSLNGDFDHPGSGQYGVLWRHMPFKLFCIAASLYHVLLVFPLVFLVDTSVPISSRHYINVSGHLRLDCDATYDGGILYFLVALGMAVSYPLCSRLFELLKSIHQKLYFISTTYIVFACVVTLVPLATVTWQTYLAAFLLGVARSPDILHFGFLRCLLGDKLYASGALVLFCMSALVEAIAMPVAGAALDASANYVAIYLGFSTITIFAALLHLIVAVVFLEQPPSSSNDLPSSSNEAEEECGCPCVCCLDSMANVYPVY